MALFRPLLSLHLDVTILIVRFRNRLRAFQSLCVFVIAYAPSNSSFSVSADAVLPKPLNIRQVDSLLAYVRKSGNKTTIADRSMSQVLSPGKRG